MDVPYNIDFLNDAARRPIDELIRRALRRPGVCRGVFVDVLECPFDTQISDKIQWMDGHLQPTQRTWNTDLIGYLDDLNIIHIEQQTSGHSDMNIRMLEYGSLISSRDGLIRYINQIYLSTDNTPVPNLLSIQPIKNLRRSIGSNFLFVDAGAWDAWAYFEHLDFDVALFGFLARNIDNERAFVEGMISRVLAEYQGQELIDRLVDCVCMGALRRRGKKVQEFIPMYLHEFIDDDPYMAEMQDKKYRQGLRILLDKAIAKARFVPPNEFIVWLSRHKNVEMVQDAALEIRSSATFEDVIATLGLEWPPVIEDNLAQDIPIMVRP